MVMDLSTIPKSLTSHLPEEQQFVLALFIQDKDHQLQIKELQHQLKMQNLEKKLVQLFREDPATIWSVTITTSPTTTNPLFLPLRTTVGPTMIPRDLEALPATLGGSSTQRKMASRELVVRLTATPLFPKSVGLVSPLPPPTTHYGNRGDPISFSITNTTSSGGTTRDDSSTPVEVLVQKVMVIARPPPPSSVPAPRVHQRRRFQRAVRISGTSEKVCHTTSPLFHHHHYPRSEKRRRPAERTAVFVSVSEVPQLLLSVCDRDVLWNGIFFVCK